MGDKSDRILVTCPTCGSERFIDKKHASRSKYNECRNCAAKRNNKNVKYGNEHGNWRGGLSMHSGYILVKLRPDDFFISMARNGRYVLEHRLVMAKHLGRCLHPFEIVHHKNGITTDNRIENLVMRDSSNHRGTYRNGFTDGYIAGFKDASAHKPSIYKPK